ncbi:MFS transporter [Streptomyces sp. NPDC051662]|uniref:MFS transporter n=1 Tax=Streptomyces sp. NPDC051662 TaxID=3154750 RepID=UPI003416AC0D
MKRYLIKVFLEHFAFGLTISVSIVWMLAQGMTLPEIAIIDSLALTLGLLIDIPTGFISDRFGRKLTLIGANIFQAASFLVFALSHDFWQFLIAAILLAVGFALSSGSEEAYIYENQSGDNYRKTFSNVNVVDEAATILGLLATPLLISLFSLQSVFIAASGFVFVTAIVSWIILKDKGNTAISEGPQKTRERQRILTLVRKHAPLVLLFVALAIYYEAGRVFWQPQMINSGFKVEDLGFLFAAFKLASLAGAYVGRHQRFSPKKEIVAIGALVTISFMLIASSVAFLVIVGFLLYSFLENVYRIVESNYLQGIASSKRRASSLSAASFVRQGYSIVSVPLLSIAAIANVSYVFYILALLQVAAAVLFGVLALRSRNAQPRGV